MSLLDTVKPDIYAAIPILGGHTVEDAYFRSTVESMISQCRKEALLEAAEWFDKYGYLDEIAGNYAEDVLRRMAEGEKLS